MHPREVQISGSTLAAAAGGSAAPALAAVLSHDHALLKLMRVLLTELEVEIFTDEIHAGTWEVIRRLQPNLVVVDVKLGQEHLAWEFVVALREHPSTRDIPVIACAAAGWLLEKQSPFIERYSIQVWSEPFDPGELVAMAAGLLRKPSNSPLDLASAP